MGSKVYYLDLGRISLSPTYAYFRKLLENAGLPNLVNKGDFVAIKLHMGEFGNIRYIRPQFVSIIVDMLVEYGCKPFLTNTTTLYRGSRYDAVGHLRTAFFNGFVFSVVNAPVIIADGLRGRDEISVRIDGEELDEVPIASLFKDVDFLLVLTHFKGHEMSGFGGAIKNLGMGCSSKRGKILQHTVSKPRINYEKCISCWTCLMACKYGAIQRNKKPKIDYDRCVGCGNCIVYCPVGAIDVEWFTGDRFLKRIAEAAYAVTKVVPKEKMFFINFLMDMTRVCDCMPMSGVPMLTDIGILASSDPVAIDMASYDLVIQMSSNKVFGGHVDPLIQLYHAEKLGLGSTKYEIIKVEAP